MKIFDARQIETLVDYSELISGLETVFKTDPDVPERSHYILNPDHHESASLLLMPAWTREYIGVKIAAIFPSNVKKGKPAVAATYLLSRGDTGESLAMMDGTALTRIRTAATSALASKFLSRDDASSLLMVGAGALAAPLVRAHCLVRDIMQIRVWNRSSDRVTELKQELELDFDVVSDLDGAVRNSDIICCATLSNMALVKGTHVKDGTHVDLVGAYTPSMRESDSRLINKASVFVDTRTGAQQEAGDLILAASESKWSFDQIQAELSQLCSGARAGRISDKEITVFKSVGASIEDLVVATLVYRASLE